MSQSDCIVESVAASKSHFFPCCLSILSILSGIFRLAFDLDVDFQAGAPAPAPAGAAGAASPAAA